MLTLTTPTSRRRPSTGHASLRWSCSVQPQSRLGAELTIHGPGNHLGSNAVDRRDHEFLAPLTDFIDDQDALTRYNVILHLLGKQPIPEGEQPWQDMAVLVRLRNELIHYKSRWGREMERQKFFKTLHQLRLPKPPFVPEGSFFFPHLLLGIMRRLVRRFGHRPSSTGSTTEWGSKADFDPTSHISTDRGRR